MLRPLTSNLLLADGEIEVSQAIPLGKHTAVNLNVTVHNCSGSVLDLRIYLQGSNDLDHWESISGYQGQITVWPGNDEFPVAYPQALCCAFVRALYENGIDSSSNPVIFSVDINLVEL